MIKAKIGKYLHSEVTSTEVVQTATDWLGWPPAEKEPRQRDQLMLNHILSYHTVKYDKTKVNKQDDRNIIN